MTTSTPAQPQIKRDVCGMIYDSSYVDDDGVTHYTRKRAGGKAGGPAHWSSEHDCNPICGDHLAMKCTACSGCLSCDGCYCYE
jgi:hypothetical protein